MCLIEQGESGWLLNINLHDIFMFKVCVFWNTFQDTELAEGSPNSVLRESNSTSKHQPVVQLLEARIKELEKEVYYNSVEWKYKTKWVIIYMVWNFAFFMTYLK